MTLRIGSTFFLLLLAIPVAAEVYECPVIKKMEIVTDYR